MRWRELHDQPCSIARSLAVIGDRWTMLLLRQAFLGTRRFEDFGAQLGLPRPVLANRLRSLVEDGLLRRERYQERPERFEYRLTEMGLDIYPVLAALVRWGDRWLAGPDGPPLHLRHTSCDHPVTASLHCAHCGTEVGAREIRAAAGPPPGYRRARRRSAKQA